MDRTGHALRKAVMAVTCTDKASQNLSTDGESRLTSSHPPGEKLLEEGGGSFFFSKGATSKVPTLW